MQDVVGLLQKSTRLSSLNCLITSLLKDGPAGTALAPRKTFTVKDCFSTKNVRTTCGSRILSNYIPPYSATVVDRLTDAGWELLGKANMDEFGMGTTGLNSAYGPAINPWTFRSRKWNELRGSRTPKELLRSDWIISGGSSSGGGPCVACGLGDISMGSDTGGSTLNPAANCGVLGLKPSYGLVSRHGLVPLVNSLDCPAFMARTVADLRTALEITSGFDEMDSTSVSPDMKMMLNHKNVKDLVIGLPKELHDRISHPDVASALHSTRQTLEEVGAKFKEVTLPHVKYSLTCYQILGFCEIASNMARYDGVEFGHRTKGEATSFREMVRMSRDEGFGTLVRKRIVAGNFFLLERNYSRYFIQAQRVRRLIKEDFSRVFREQGVDVMMAPVTHTPPPLRSELGGQQSLWYEDDFLTQGNNMAGIPAISIPTSISSDSTPVGVQFIADYLNEPLLLDIASWFEERGLLTPIVDFDVDHVLDVLE